VIVLDTYAWVWWVSEPERLTARGRTTIEAAASRGDVHVSSISAWEVAMLVAKGRLELTMPVVEWVALSEALPYLRFVPVDNALALSSVSLEGFSHPDPADRLILATARWLDAAVVTKDRRMRAYRKVKTVW
jgi:PIN domain nuclease of toxin-antitoxin system